MKNTFFFSPNIVIGVYSYSFDDEESIESGFKAIGLATFWATAEPKMSNFDYHIVLGVNFYVFDDEKLIKSGLKDIWPPRVSLFTTFGATTKHKNKLIKSISS